MEARDPRKWEKPTVKPFRTCINIDADTLIIDGLLMGYTGGNNDYPRFYNHRKK